MIKIEVDDRGVLDALNELLRRGEDLRPPLQEIGDSLADTTRLRFRDQVSPSGEPWPELAIATLISRGKRAIGVHKQSELRHKGGHTLPDALSAMLSAKALLDTGALRNSIAVAVGDNYVEVGTVEPHGEGSARIHQFGGQAGRGKKVTIPPRPFFGVSDEDRTNILDILNDYLAEAWK